MEVGEVGWGKVFEKHELTHGEGSEQALSTYLLLHYCYAIFIS